MSIKTSYLLIIILLSPIYLTSQINIGGLPNSFKAENKTVNTDEIPELVLPSQDNKSLMTEADKNYSKDMPWQFGKNILVNIDLKKEAMRESLKNGSLYRLKITSKNAESLNLRFSTYNIPAEATLYIYSSDKNQILGGFTSHNNQDDQVFATGLIFYHEIILEYYEPYNVKFTGNLIINQITHGFRNFSEKVKGFGSSGDCNMNVACDDGTWSNEIRSACMLVVGGSGLCSGSLINNSQFDETPYILTADHCNFDPSSIVFWFNWESETCDNPITVPDHDFISGSVQIAESAYSDFSLLKMNFTPPTEYNVYYAGWDASDNPSSYTVGIHHPAGDIKKISYDDDPCISDLYLGVSGALDFHWKVIWDRNTTTEGGSSGSALFNENQKIIGQLHGGYASCDNLNEPDWYGKFSKSWDYGINVSSRLKDWLDPLNLGFLELEGYDPNIPVADDDAELVNILEPQNNTTDNGAIQPTFLIRNRGNNNLTSLDISYSIDNGQVVTQTWTGDLSTLDNTTIVFDKIYLPQGEHTILAYIENPNGVPDGNLLNDTIEKNFLVYEIIFSDDFESGNVWNLTGEFEINSPQGLGGSSGKPDPENAYSEMNVLGLDLSGLGNFPGDYEPFTASFEEYAESPPINCNSYIDTKLFFYKWLNVEENINDKVFVQINNDNSWSNIFLNSKPYSDTSWTKEVIDISKYADQKRIRIRFVSGNTDGNNQYSGWNIDNFIIAGRKNLVVTEITDEIIVYPNPASSFFYIEFPEFTGTAYITLADISGKVIYERQITEKDVKFLVNSGKNLFKMNPDEDLFGFYILKLKTNSKDLFTKILLM